MYRQLFYGALLLGAWFLASWLLMWALTFDPIRIYGSAVVAAVGVYFGVRRLRNSN